ncbi:helix-turn-helix domain-containing protein [Thermorudis peleae]|uniref:helix-turn-helix domain-containing protein n=1 Tax=Thermorudis peleae TaxID=1382356 RepID=UPI00056EBE24|nr:helix-turn-helix domain-containing protein [Thermorudis peleae]
MQDLTTEYLTPAEAARMLEVSVERVRTWLKTGRMACVKTPLGRLIPPQEVERIAVERAKKGGKDGTVTTPVASGMQPVE